MNLSPLAIALQGVLFGPLLIATQGLLPTVLESPPPSFDASIYEVLAGLVDGRVFPGWAPHDTPRPYVVYHQVGGKVVRTLDVSRPVRLRNARVQINVWASTSSEAQALLSQAVQALRSELLANTRGDAIGLDEPALRLYGAMQDVSIWYRSS